MRTPFRKCDKDLLLEAVYGRDGDLQHVQNVLRSKLFQDGTIYTYVLAHPEEAFSPLETNILYIHGEWDAEIQRREELACKLGVTAECTCHK